MLPLLRDVAGLSVEVHATASKHHATSIVRELQSIDKVDFLWKEVGHGTVLLWERWGLLGMGALMKQEQMAVACLCCGPPAFMYGKGLHLAFIPRLPIDGVMNRYALEMQEAQSRDALIAVLLLYECQGTHIQSPLSCACL